MKRLLREDLVLRGWEKLPYAVVERPHNGVRFVDARTFEALSLCDGQIDLSLPIISDEVRAFVEKLEEQGACLLYTSKRRRSTTTATFCASVWPSCPAASRSWKWAPPRSPR